MSSQPTSEPGLRAVVGLGNPGSEYERTRHNAGFWFVDALAAEHGGSFRRDPKCHGHVAQVRLSGQTLLLLKPDTFMNRSGTAVQALRAFYKIEPGELLIAHDELDLPVGTVRLKAGGGHGGHNGLRDLHRHLGPDYRRLRIGVGHPGLKELVTHYLTEQRVAATEEKTIRAALGAACATIPALMAHGWNKAVHQLHSIETHGN